MPKTNRKQLEELSELLEAKINSVKYNKLHTLYPATGPYRRELYQKHIEFMNAGAKYSQRAFIAANRTGKTLTGATEVAYHMTGLYPDWWEGRRFKNPVEVWVAGVTAPTTKEITQKALLGPNDDLGSGTIPRHLIVGKPSKKSGVRGAIEEFKVRHVSGGISECIFKSYEEGADKFQGTKKQVIWLDEEPKDYGIYSECFMRTADKIAPGIILCTFTPLFGLSAVVMSFLKDGQFPKDGVDPENPNKYVAHVDWNEVPHLTEEWKTEALAACLPHERDARSRGIPSLGAGRIYPYLDDDVTVEPFPIPPWWPRAYGFDIGVRRTAAVWGAKDPDTNIIYLYSEYYAGEALPLVHAHAIKCRGEWIRGAIDPASLGKGISDLRKIYDIYLEQGLDLELAKNDVEAGIMSINQLLASGQLKVFNTLQNWLTEFRVYRRDENGKIVDNQKDHLMDATKYFILTGLDILETPPEPAYDDEDYRDSANTYRDPYTGY